MRLLGEEVGLEKHTNIKKIKVPARIPLQGEWACFVSQVRWKERRKGEESAINFYNFLCSPKPQMSGVTVHFFNRPRTRQNRSGNLMVFFSWSEHLGFTTFLSPASEASWEVANLTRRKNTHTPVYGVKEFVCLSVCLSVCSKFRPQFS